MPKNTKRESCVFVNACEFQGRKCKPGCKEKINVKVIYRSQTDSKQE